MQLLERTELTREQRVFFITFGLLVLAPFYYQDNLGGEGLNLPFNAAIWIAGLLCTAAGMLAMLNRQTFILPRHTLLILLFPAGLIAGGFITGIDNPSEWMIRLGVISGGILFWFALFQFRLSRRHVETALYLLLASILAQSFIGIAQLFPDTPLAHWILWGIRQRPLGIYQQPNVQASMMATGMAIAFYMATTPGYQGQRWPIKSLIWLTLLLTSANLVVGGSRVGLLGGAVALGLLLASRAQILLTRRWTALAIILALGAGAALGTKINSGESAQAVSKFERLATAANSDARTHIYRIAWRAFEQAPLLGHGIGSFQRVFQDARVPYYKDVPNYKIDDKRFSHPHNEILFWLIEGGLLALASILAAAVATLWQLTQLGWKRGLSMMALIFPILLHTQVELPFYISNVHWFVLLILLFVIFQTGKQERTLTISHSMKLTCRGLTLAIYPLIAMFLIHTLLANAGIVQYIRSKGRVPQHLNLALNDFYFRQRGQLLLMRLLLYRDLQTKSTKHVAEYIQWAKQYLAQIPAKNVYVDLSQAYIALNQREEAKKVIDEVTAIYPDDKHLQQVKRNIEKGKAALTIGTSHARHPPPPPASPAQ